VHLVLAGRHQAGAVLDGTFEEAGECGAANL